MGRFNEERTKFHKVSKLTGRSWSSIEPDQNGIVSQLSTRSMFPAIENKSKHRVSLSNLKIASHDSSIVIIRSDIQVDLITASANIDRIFVRFLKNSIGDINT